MININYQRNMNDCGVCVLQSLIEKMHHKKIDYSTLLSEFNLTNNGISIFDLETVGLKYGIILDSYEATLDELKQYQKTRFFILLIKNNDLLHYVIASKNKDKVDIYCSEKGYYQLSYDEIAKIWTGILIECSKTNFKIKHVQTKNIWSNLNWFYIISNNVLNIVLIFLSIIAASFIKNYINIVINNNQLSNLLGFIILFLLINISKNIGEKCLMAWNVHTSYKHYIYLNKMIINRLRHKHITFYNKIDVNNVKNIDEHLIRLSNFYNITFNKFITDIVFVILTNIIIFACNWYIGMIVLILLFIEIFFDIIIYLCNKTKHHKFESYRNEYINNYHKFIYQSQSTLSLDDSTLIIKKIDKAQFNLKQLFYSTFRINNFLNLSNEIFFQIIYMIIFIISAYYIVNVKTLSLARLMFIISIFQLNISNLKNILNITKQIMPLKYSFDIVRVILENENSDNVGILSINELKKIYYKNLTILNDTLIKGKSGCGKTTMLMNICNMRNDQIDISYNLINKRNISHQFFINNCLYISNKTSFNEETIINLLQDANYQEIVSYFVNLLNIKNFDNLSIGQKQCLIFISLIKYKSKIILLDELLSNVDANLKNELLKYIKPWIVKNNFLIYVSHDLNNEQYFMNVVDYE